MEGILPKKSSVVDCYGTVIYEHDILEVVLRNVDPKTMQMVITRIRGNISCDDKCNFFFIATDNTGKKSAPLNLLNLAEKQPGKDFEVINI